MRVLKSLIWNDWGGILRLRGTNDFRNSGKSTPNDFYTEVGSDESAFPSPLRLSVESSPRRALDNAVT